MLLSQLPAPTRDYARPQVEAPAAAASENAPRRTKEPPPYGSKERRGYVPRKLEDYGDGGGVPSNI